MYHIKETFYTLQGEGANAGRAAVFLRFTGCNLWSGRAEDRTKGSGGCSRWCDTDFVGTDGPGGGRFVSPTDLARHVGERWGGGSRERFVVCTGGEPTLQMDAPLVDALHAYGFEVAIETNGTRPLPNGLDWICVSPKVGTSILVHEGDELKVVVPQDGLDLDDLATWNFGRFYVQPMDDDSREAHTMTAVEICRRDPRWRLSLQTHKMLGIP